MLTIANLVYYANLLLPGSSLREDFSEKAILEAAKIKMARQMIVVHWRSRGLMYVF